MAKKGNLVGAWAFLIGVILAVIIGILQLSATEGVYAIILIILGIIIGLLNVAGPESKEFLIAGAILVIVSGMGGQAYLSEIPFVGEIIKALVVMFVPATIVVALKSVFAIAKK
ncbi:MAG: hypothetical protein NT076_02375 [Candidatus Pacearchaeota archaeon]|nr:hypothetical protein [Candidatus Pacearchaeota archaeon]